MFAGVVVIVLLYLLSRQNYLLFHCTAEFFSIFVALAIFVVAWNTRAWASNRYLLFLGIAYLFVAIIDTTHTLAYKGMGVFAIQGANEATQLWILARYIEAFSLLAAPLFITRRLRAIPLFIVYAAVCGFGLLDIFRLGIFPDCFIEGQGLTPFKVASEYVIIGLLAGAIAHLLRYREKLEPRIMTLLVAAMAVTIVEEMAFTLYTDVYGLSNMIGHLLKAASFYLVYRAVVETSLTAPYQLLFRELVKAREDAERERDASQRYLDIVGVMLVVLDTTGRVRHINKKGAEILGYSEEEILGRDWFTAFVPESQRTAVREVFRQLRAGQQTKSSCYSENAVLTRSREERVLAWHNTVVHDPDGAVVETLGCGEDITERLRMETALSASEEEFRTLFERSMDAIYLVDYDGSNMRVNSSWLKLFGYTGEEVSHLNIIDIYANPADRQDLLKAIARKGNVDDEVRFKKKDGTEFDCARTVTARRDEQGNVRAFQGIMRDVTQQKRDHAELGRLARFDVLTGLLNRRTILEKLDEWVLHVGRYKGHLSVAMLDIDHFKRVNDHYGHQTGDHVLADTAQAMQRGARLTDFAGRYGGEEFLVVLPKTDASGAALMAERIRASLQAMPMHGAEGKPFHVTVSIGIAEWCDGEDVDALIGRADAALYRAKATGRNRVEIAAPIKRQS